jgi:signal transduction histidine kinase
MKQSLALRRQKRLNDLLVLIIGVTAVSVVTFFIHGALLVAEGSGFVCVTSVLALLAARRGVPVSLIITVFLSAGMAVAAVTAVWRGESGFTALFWLALAPVIALGIGGRGSAWFVLAVTVVLEVASLMAIKHHWVEPIFQAQDQLMPQITSLVGACLTFFLVVRSYDGETERTIAELTQRNEELSAARRDADQASRAKSDFLATMSHEIRTPLNGVLGMTSVLLDEPTAPKVTEGLRVIQRSGDMLLAVLNDVLDFSKIESNHFELEAVPVNVADELRAVVSLLSSRADSQDDVVSVHIADDVPTWFVGDPTRVRQVMLNLLSNAVKFTQRGRVELSLAYTDQVLTLSVADTGIGMSAEAQRRLFEPFVQGDASTTRRFGGTGLGLVITQRLVKAMNGSIEVFSEEGHGSRFTVRLPLAVCAAPQVEPVLPAQVVPSKRVLLVEDNAVNQMVAAKLIARLGHEVVVAADGHEALGAFGSGVFDVVLMDCHMPVLDGFDATRELRRKGAVIPILALTAAATTEDRAKCLAAGMNDVITKPIKLEILLRHLGTAVGEGRA